MFKEKYGYLAKNTLLFTISSFGSKILAFFLVPLYTNILSTAEYGMADIITTSTLLLGYVFSLNVGDGVLRLTLDDYSNAKAILAFGFKIVFTGTVVLSFLVIFIYKLGLFNWPDYCYVFLILYYFGFVLSQMLGNYLRAVNKIKDVAISGILTTFVTICSNLLFLLWFKWGLAGYLLSMILGVFLTCIYQLLIIGEPISNYFTLRCEYIIRHEILKYSIPLIFNGIAWWMNSSLDKFFIVGILGAAENGIYAVAYKIPTLLTMFQSIFNQAWNLSAIKDFDRNDSDGFFSKMYQTYNAGLVIGCSFLIVFNVLLAKVLFAKDFFAAWRYSSVLLLSIIFSALSGFVGSIFSAVKDSRIFAVSTVMAAIINTVLNAILIPFYGAMGAAVATAVSFFVIWLIRMKSAKKYICLKINVKKDLLAYILLIVQVIFEHLEGHVYWGQALITVILIIMYWKLIFEMLKKAINIF